MRVEYARNPSRVGSDGPIDLIVKFEELPDEVPFTASDRDPADHGRYLFAQAEAGAYGDIAQRQPPKPTPEDVDQMRRAAYSEEADPLFFLWQRGESTEQAWLDKIAEIKARYPKE